MTDIKLTDSKIHDRTGEMGLEPRQRALLDAAFQIYAHKYGVLDEEKIKELLRHLESAGLISGGARERAIDKMTVEQKEE